MSSTTFSYTRFSGAVLAETFENSAWHLHYADSDGSRMLYAYAPDEAPKPPRNNLYLGHDPRTILDSGRDILGEALIAAGDPDFSQVEACLPELTKDAYCFLGGSNSQGSLTVDLSGRVYPPYSDRDREPLPLFDPTTADETLGALTPRQYMLDGQFPLLYNIFSDGSRVMELLYFVESGDVCHSPTLWIRVRKYLRSSPLDTLSTEYRITTASRESPEADMGFNTVAEPLFLECFADTVAFWLKEARQGTVMQLPNKILSNAATGTMLSLLSTFTAQRPHYGHKFYGRELHDNFPPNLLWSMEACCLMGRPAMAKRIFEHMLLYIVNDEGRICYRQGSGMRFGSAAAEYGQLLHLAEKYRHHLGLTAADFDLFKLERLRGMGRVILSHFVECPEFGGCKLIKMCAEADNNGRIHVYLGNNLWSIRGLQSLSALLTDLGLADTDGFGDAAALLQQNIRELLSKESIRDPRFGLLPPFRFGYTPAPLTLSNCRDTFSPVSEADMHRYFNAPRHRDDTGVEVQDLTENTYANYRYYPESLSAMLLSEDAANGILSLKDQLGGSILGMIHFRDWLDDWPVMHYARYLLETDRIERYLLLLYAHTLHHGRPDLMCYYEQVRITGEVKAPDCVPSLLTTPILLGWMFAYETMNDHRLRLLSALPKDWYGKPFSVSQLGYSGGTVDIVSDGHFITFEFSDPCPIGTELICRAIDTLSPANIVSGLEYIASIEGNRVLIKPGLRHIKLQIR